MFNQINSLTTQGVARASFNIDRAGLLEISASSVPGNQFGCHAIDCHQPGFHRNNHYAYTGSRIYPHTNRNYRNTGCCSIFPVGARLSGLCRLAGRSGFAVRFRIIAYWLGERLARVRWGVRWAICVVLGGFTGVYLSCDTPAGGSAVFAKRRVVRHAGSGFTGRCGRIRRGIYLVPTG